MAWEVRALRRWKRRPVIEVDGPGPGAARVAAERAVARGARWLCSWGSAGSLGDAASGDIVIADAILDPAGIRWVCDPDSARQLLRLLADIAPMHCGVVYSADEPIAGVAAKRAIAERTGALAVDMESAAVAGVAAQAGLPFAALRVIVDAADRSVPSAAIAALDGPRPRGFRIARGLLESPGQIGPLIALARAAGRARRTLGVCARRLEIESPRPS